MRQLFVRLVIGSAILSMTSSAWAGPPAQRFDRHVTIQPSGRAAPPERVSVLVHLDPAADRSRVRDFARSEGGRVQYEYDLLPNVVNLRGIPKSSVPRLERIDGVRRIEADPTVRMHLNQSTPLIHARQDQIGGAGYDATAVSGQNVRVCIVDTGIAQGHAMYADRVDLAAGRDFVNNDNDPEDDNGHGTHVAGIAVGGDNTIDICTPSEPFQGVAWRATVIGVKVIDAAGFGTESDVIAGIDYCANQTASGGRADVINLSVGAGLYPSTCDSDTFAAAANAAVDKGVVVVASSGNDGAFDELATPACGSKVIAVGATYDDDYGLANCEWPIDCFEWCIGGSDLCGCAQSCSDCAPQAGQYACFSNRSHLLDVVAPGCFTLSADYAVANGATYQCGTSMAAPHVAGLAAVLLSATPSRTPAAVRQAIRDGAIDEGAAGFDSTYGYGLVDALGSLARVVCSTATDCNDGNACTADSCVAASCVNEPITACAADGCCVASCTADPDCPTCQPAGQSCSSGSQCCSGKCTGRSGSKTCR